jgi:hypothetical protein
LFIFLLGKTALEIQHSRSFIDFKNTYGSKRELLFTSQMLRVFLKSSNSDEIDKKK